MPAIPSSSPPPRGNDIARVLRAADDLELEIVQTYDEHSTGLFRFALAFSKNWEVAEDALQEAFLRYFQARKLGQEIPNCRAWLYRVLRNQLLDRSRDFKTRNEVSIQTAPGQSDSSENPESDCLRSELARRIQGVLTPRELECLQLRSQGLPYDQIAEMMRIRQGTVGAILTHALKKIRKAIGPLAEGLV
jgi:RNA polymerase sigma-70 factor (ECF subfamily)